MEEVKGTNFWCHACRKDWMLGAIQRWLNHLTGNVWCARCPDCGVRLIRLRDVQAMLDPYFRRSRFLKAQRRKHADSLVQYNDPRFDMLYPHLRKEREAKLEAQERQRYEQTH